MGPIGVGISLTVIWVEVAGFRAGPAFFARGPGFLSVVISFKGACVLMSFLSFSLHWGIMGPSHDAA